MDYQLSNVMWHCLAGPHRAFSIGTDSVRRYAPGFSPMIGFADPAGADFAELLPFTHPGEQFYCEHWAGEAQAGWRVVHETRMRRMVLARPAPDDIAQDGVRALGPTDAEAALALALAQRPGPFGLRTMELGEYLGRHDDAGLVCMAGERMQLAGWREVSGICTAPRAHGRGYARQLTALLLQRAQSRGERTFLNVMATNIPARRLYESLGFEDFQESLIRIVERIA